MGACAFQSLDFFFFSLAHLPSDLKLQFGKALRACAHWPQVAGVPSPLPPSPILFHVHCLKQYSSQFLYVHFKSKSVYLYKVLLKKFFKVQKKKKSQVGIPVGKMAEAGGDMW